MVLFDKLEIFKKRNDEINEMLFDPNVVSNQEKYKSLMKEQKNLIPIVEKYDEYKLAKNNAEEAKQLLNDGGLDKDFREMVEAELEESREAIEKISEELKILLLPKDPNDDRNVIVEIRGGAGSANRFVVESRSIEYPQEIQALSSSQLSCGGSYNPIPTACANINVLGSVR